MRDVKYNPQVLQSFADDLYARADWIVIQTIARYAVVTFVAAFAALNFFPNEIRTNGTIDSVALVTLVPALLAGPMAWSVGATKAFQLRLQAQQILCQKQIEANTR